MENIKLRQKFHHIIHIMLLQNACWLACFKAILHDGKGKLWRGKLVFAQQKKAPSILFKQYFDTTLGVC